MQLTRHLQRAKALLQRRKEKKSARTASMAGWRGSGENPMHEKSIESSRLQRHVSVGIGFHPSRSIKGHS